MPDSNLEQLIAAAQLLRQLLRELVFVGGSVTGLLITDEGAADPRTTFDVDAIAEMRLAIVCARSVSRKIQTRARRCADGFNNRRYSTSCR